MKEKAKPHRILFGTVDIGWRISQYKSFLENQLNDQVYIKSFIKHKVSKEQYQTDYDFHFQYIKYPKIVQWFISFGFFCYALLQFDTFYFFSGESILTRKLRRFEFKVYRFLNKRIIMHFVGSDIRDYHYLYWKNENLMSKSKEKDRYPISTHWQKKLISDSQDYANQILVSTPDLLAIAKSAKYYPVVLDVHAFQNELTEKSNPTQGSHFKSNKVKVLHAPSNPNAKGSIFIDQVVEELLSEYDNFEYLNTQHLNRETRSLYSVSRYELFQLYKEADIVIDQMVIGWYGMQSIEAILAENLVICFIDQNLKKYLYPDCPILNSNILQLKENLLLAIDQVKNEMIDYNAQIKWVKKYHNIESNHDLIIEALNLKT